MLCLLKTLKTIFLAIFVLFLVGGVSIADTQVNFSWTANPELDLAGYRVYASNTSGVYTLGEGNQIATAGAGDTACSVAGIADGTWFWVLTAYDTNGNESVPSDEQTGDLDTTAPGCPVDFNVTFE